MKKALSLALALVLAFALAIPAFAAPVASNGYAGDGNPTFVDPANTETIITYNVSGYYTVTIPDSFTFTSSDDVSEAKNVTIENVLLGYGQTVKVSASYDGKLKLKKSNGITLDYELYSGEDKITADSTAQQVAVAQANGENGFYNLATVTKAITAKLAADQNVKYAGVYTATVTFSVTVTNPA